MKTHVSDEGLLSARLVAPAALSPADLDLWERWMAADPNLRSAFYSPTFAAAAAAAYGGVTVGVLHDSSGPAAFFPFQRLEGLAGRLGGACRVGEEMSDYFGVVARPGVRISPARLLSLCRIEHLYFTHLDDAQRSFDLVGEQPEVGLRIDLSGGSARYWENLHSTDRKFLPATERRRQKLEDQYGPIRFQLQSDDPMHDLEHLITIKRDQYRRTGAGDLFERPERRRLLESLVKARAASCTGVMSTLFAGDTWAASRFSLLCCGVLHFWFPVYNFELRSFSPGRLLTQCTINAAEAAGFQVIDYGAGDTPAKRDFANVDHTYFRGVWHRGSPSAQVLRIMQSLSWRFGYLRKHYEGRAG